jgi:hypothetical protein
MRKDIPRCFVLLLITIYDLKAFVIFEICTPNFMFIFISLAIRYLFLLVFFLLLCFDLQSLMRVVYDLS